MAETKQARSVWRRVGIAALLPLEVILLTLNFEPARLGTASQWSVSLLEHSSILPRIAIAVAGTLVLVLSPRAGALWERFGADSRRYPWEWVVLHLACYAVFYQETAWLFGPAAGDPPTWHLWLWVFLCASVGVSWCIALAPAGMWRGLLVAERTAVLASLLAGIAVWVFGVLTRYLWKPLAEWTLFFAQGLLRGIYDGVEYDPVAGTVGTKRILIEIAPQCSGYEGLALITVFVAVYLWMFRDRLAFPRAFWLWPAGLAAMWIANVFRIAALAVIGTSISPQIAVQGFHSQAGWISFTVIGLGLVWISHRMGLLTKHAPHAAEEASPSIAAAFIAPLIALLATAMVAAAFSDGFDVLYPLTVVATAAALFHYRHVYRGLAFAVSPVAIAIGVGVFVIWIALEPSSPGTPSPTVARLSELPPALAAAWLVLRAIGTVVTVPIAEELAFRGYLLRKLVASDFENVPATRFTLLSFAGSSIVFGMLHQSWIAGTIAGAAFALAVYHRGRVVDAVVAHMTANALIAATAVAFGWWDLWI